MPNDQANASDPLEFVRNMWGNMGFSLPGMVVPTFDVDELEKRITDLKAVEGWLRMNLSMLQMTIQSMEMQKATLSAVRAMGTMAANASQNLAQNAAPAPGATPAGGDATDAAGAFSQAALWPWNMMQQMQEHLQQQAEQAKTQAAAAEKPKAAPRKASRKQ